MLYKLSLDVLDLSVDAVSKDIHKISGGALGDQDNRLAHARCA
jgi:hypothetical protein